MSVNFQGQQPNNNPLNIRAVLDANFIQNVALPNSPNTSCTNAINLQTATPFPTTETINIQAIVSSATTTANSKNINVAIQHTTANTDGTANSSNWVNIGTLAAPILVTTDSAGTNPGGNVIFKLPPGCNQFIRAQFVSEANGGTAVTGTGTLQLLF